MKKVIMFSILIALLSVSAYSQTSTILTKMRLAITELEEDEPVFTYAVPVFYYPVTPSPADFDSPVSSTLEDERPQMMKEREAAQAANTDSQAAQDAIDDAMRSYEEALRLMQEMIRHQQEIINNITRSGM